MSNQDGYIMRKVNGKYPLYGATPSYNQPWHFPFPLPLDLFTGSRGAFSVRKLTRTWLGDCMVVRRSSDNATQSIGFIGNEQPVLDETALTTFIGAGNGFVETWFDQSGAGFHVRNTTQSQQPKIATGGIVATMSNSTTVFPTVRFDNRSAFLNLSNPSLTLTKPFSSFSTFRLSAASGMGASTLFDWPVAASGPNPQTAAFLANGITEPPNNQWQLGGILNSSNYNTNPRRLVGQIKTGAHFYRINGASVSNTTVTIPDFSNGIRIGNLRVNIAPTYSWDGDVSEMIFFDNDLTLAQHTGIENELDKYFKTPAS